MAFCIGMGYEKFENKSKEFKKNITEEARAYAQKMNAPLIYCSAETKVNIQQLWLLIVCKMFNMDPPRIARKSKYQYQAIFELEPVSASHTVSYDDIYTGLDNAFVWNSTAATPEEKKSDSSRAVPRSNIQVDMLRQESNLLIKEIHGFSSLVETMQVSNHIPIDSDTSNDSNGSILSISTTSASSDDSAPVDIDIDPRISRIIVAMNNYTEMNDQEFLRYCNEQYQELLDDYVYIMSAHVDDLEILFDSKDASTSTTRKYCTDIDNCRTFSRHCRNIEDDDKTDSEDEDIQFVRDIMDSLHCYVWHLYDSGMRLTKDDIDGLNQKDMDEGEELRQQRAIIHSRSRELMKNRFRSHKFKIVTNPEKIIDAEKIAINKCTNITFVDTIPCHAQFVAAGGYDTDSIIDDVTDCIQSQSNIGRRLTYTEYKLMKTKIQNYQSMSIIYINIFVYHFLSQ